MKFNLNIIDNSKKFIGLSLCLVVLSIAIIFTRGLNYGIDFSGGNLFQIKYEKAVSLSDINNKLNELEDQIPEAGPNSRKVQIADDGTVIIRIQEISEAEKNIVKAKLQELGSFHLEKEDKVGASVGSELKSSAIYSLVIGAILIVLYITFRFEFTFSVGAILSLMHDIIISVGFISLFQYEIDTPFIAAILTILGYSINDTIVVYDRIRENFHKTDKWTLAECMNRSINQVMIRSFNTSLTTLFSIVALLLFGGDSLKTFVVTLLIGMLTGTYSSVFIATPIVYMLNKNRNTIDKLKEKSKKKEEEPVEKILV